jgi:hypothetical protein
MIAAAITITTISTCTQIQNGDIAASLGGLGVARRRTLP